MTVRQVIESRGWVEDVADERAIGNSLIVSLRTPFCFEEDVGCGTMGFDTWTEAERGTRVGAVYEAVDSDTIENAGSAA